MFFSKRFSMILHFIFSSSQVETITRRSTRTEGQRTLTILTIHLLRESLTFILFISHFPFRFVCINHTNVVANDKKNHEKTMMKEIYFLKRE